MSVDTSWIVPCEEFDHSLENPFRRPDWRSMRATLHRRLRSDEWVKRVRRFRERDEAPRFDKDLFGAHQTHRGPRWRRAEIQARILAGQVPAAIAARTGVTLSELLAYEQVFFDVRSRLQNTSFIRYDVIAPPPLGVYGWNDLERYWNHAAYFRGPKTLDLLIECVPLEGLGRYGLDAYLNKDYSVPEDVRFAVMVDRMAIGKEKGDLAAYRQLLNRVRPAKADATSAEADSAAWQTAPSAEALSSWEEHLAAVRSVIPDLQLAS